MEIEPTPGRRERIEDLLEPTWPEDRMTVYIAKANVYALLEIADAIDRLAAEVEKVSWSREPRS